VADTIYTDADGTQYRAVGLMPYRELTPETPFAERGQTKVWRKGIFRPSGKGELGGLLVAAYNAVQVIVLEKV
jgi:hypothetical protein